VAELEKLDWYRYWSGKTVLGTRDGYQLVAVKAAGLTIL
jgi:hypothetical protein